MITVDNITRQYTNQKGSVVTAIKDVSLEAKKGEIVCIVGPSGSGKSTVLKCITGIDTGYEGSIQIDGVHIQDYLKKHRIALVSQRYSNFPWLTVRENIFVGFHNRGMSKVEVSVSADALLKRVGLYKARDLHISRLSGGMKQRVAIARAIAQDTDIIAFDEPFGALDVQTRSQMQELLSKLWQEEKKTMILVTHDIDEAIYLADRILVLGASPGTIKKVVPVEIKRPRKSEIRFREDFVKIKKYINYIIRSESIKANLEEGVINDNTIFKMGLYIWPGNTPLYYAKDTGLLTNSLIDVEQINFDDNREKVDLWQKGKIDTINVTLDKAIELHSKNSDTRVIKVLNRSKGGDALITQESISSVKELKGKTIGLEKGSVAEFFLLYILHKEGMSSADVTIQNMKGGEIGAGIISGKIDGGILWEPWLGKARELSNINILKTSKEYPVLYDVLIARDSVVREKGDEIEKISTVWNEAVSLLSKKKNEVVSVVSSHIGIPETELDGFLSEINFFGTTPKNIFTVFEDIESVLIAEKIVKKHENPEELFLTSSSASSLDTAQ